MSEDSIQRKVAVILATDVVGYSDKIEQDEERIGISKAHSTFFAMSGTG